MNFGMTELLIILVIAVVIFGANRLPELGRGLGKASATSRTPHATPPKRDTSRL